MQPRRHIHLDHVYQVPAPLRRAILRHAADLLQRQSPPRTIRQALGEFSERGFYEFARCLRLQLLRDHVRPRLVRELSDPLILDILAAHVRDQLEAASAAMAAAPSGTGVSPVM